jgi:hypothetical protein
MKITQAEKTQTVDPDKINKVYNEVVKCFQETRLTVNELLLVIGNLTYTLGASIGGHKDKGPSLEELDKAYALKPSIDVALMLSGLQTCQWQLDLEKKYEEILAEEKAKYAKL